MAAYFRPMRESSLSRPVAVVLPEQEPILDAVAGRTPARTETPKIWAIGSAVVISLGLWALIFVAISALVR